MCMWWDKSHEIFFILLIFVEYISCFCSSAQSIWLTTTNFTNFTNYTGNGRAEGLICIIREISSCFYRSKRESLFGKRESLLDERESLLSVGERWHIPAQLLLQEMFKNCLHCHFLLYIADCLTFIPYNWGDSTVTYCHFFGPHLAIYSIRTTQRRAVSVTVLSRWTGKTLQKWQQVTVLSPQFQSLKYWNTIY